MRTKKTQRTVSLKYFDIFRTNSRDFSREELKDIETIASSNLFKIGFLKKDDLWDSKINKKSITIIRYRKS